MAATSALLLLGFEAEEAAAARAALGPACSGAGVAVLDASGAVLARSVVDTLASLSTLGSLVGSGRCGGTAPEAGRPGADATRAAPGACAQHDEQGHAELLLPASCGGEGRLALLLGPARAALGEAAVRPRAELLCPCVWHTLTPPRGALPRPHTELARRGWHSAQKLYMHAEHVAQQCLHDHGGRGGRSVLLPVWSMTIQIGGDAQLAAWVGRRLLHVRRVNAGGRAGLSPAWAPPCPHDHRRMITGEVGPAPARRHRGKLHS